MRVTRSPRPIIAVVCGNLKLWEGLRPEGIPPPVRIPPTKLPLLEDRADLRVPAPQASVARFLGDYRGQMIGGEEASSRHRAAWREFVANDPEEPLVFQNWSVEYYHFAIPSRGILRAQLILSPTYRQYVP